ncbi:ras gtpase-activating protein [Anaeramoeba flamelloides]|uniref:Ras gtpase-activating protein n=1 Tax=Anaeramoeba flamelloides TaxID=1746091 RepID=A0ABQ8YR47_9EUKA|nr:ras gtpase-activating protein [Anaeramoeba flamelloides]
MKFQYLFVSLLILVHFHIGFTNGAGLTATVSSEKKYFGSETPNDNTDVKVGWVDLANANTDKPTLKDTPPTTLDDYKDSASRTVLRPSSSGRVYSISNFGFNLPPASKTSLTINEINFSSIRDAAPISKSKEDSLGLDWVWDSNLYFYMPDASGKDTLSIEIIRHDERDSDNDIKMTNWASESDSQDCESLRVFGGSNSNIPEQSHAQGINSADFKIEGTVQVDNPNDPPSNVPEDYPSNEYEWNLVIGQMFTKINFTYQLEVERIYPQEGKVGDLIKVYVTPGSLVDGGDYDGIAIDWNCKIGDEKFAASEIDKINSWIGCIVPDIESEANHSIDVSFFLGNIDTIEYTTSGLELYIYKTCTQDSQCLNDGKCESFFCNCVSPYYGETCEKEKCENVDCGSGKCNSETGECDCKDGFGGQNCENDLCQIEYENCTYPQGTCMYTGKVGYCYCDPEEGYTGDKCNMHKCTKKDCGQNASPERGRCFPNGECKCLTNYGGSNCQIMNCIEGNNKCEHGECQQDDGSCVCDTGYNGTLCDNYLCENTVCKNGGKCVEETGECECVGDWEGPDCGTEKEPESFLDAGADALGIGYTAFLILFIFVIIVALILISLIVFFVSKKLFVRDRYADILSLPIYDHLSLFGTGYYIPDHEISRITKQSMKKNFFDLQELLLEHLDFVNCLCIAAETKVADYLPKSLLFIFESNGESSLLLKHFLEKEVNECEDGDLLFRGYSMASKLWSSFCHLVYGIEYLHKVLSQPMYDLLNEQEKMDVELDPERVGHQNDQVKNKYNLMAATDSFMSSIFSNSEELPTQLRFFLSYTRELLEEKFPDRISQAIGGMMVLRYFVPAITACDDYGIMDDEPDDDLLRVLVLVAKVLINLANGTLFGIKEEYMATLNDFINDNQDKMSKYLLEISTHTEESKDELSIQSSPLPEDVLEISCANVHRYMALNTEQILDTVEIEIDDEERKKFLIKEMQSLIFKIGEPIDITADEVV